MKINKNLIILSLLLILCITLGTVSATEDISVNDTATDDSVATVESSPINEEINTVGNGEIHNSSEIYGEINRAIDTYYMEYDYQIDQTWDIFGDIIIDGQGHTIYGNGKQAFNIEGTGITIRNFNFMNFSVNYNGSAIYFGGSGSGSVSNCSFVNCSATDKGGAIYFRPTVFGSVRDCSFVNCSATDKGGAIYFGNPEKVSVWNCSFVNCSATDKGGAIYFGGSGSVSSCSFVNCSATDKGGAIYFVGNGVSRGSVSSCSFVNCSAKRDSAVYDMNRVCISRCSFVNCIDNGSYPVFKPKVILTVDDVEGVSGSTVKVNVGVHDILGTPINEGTVSISLNGKEYTAKVIDGIATFNIIIPSKEAIYSANVLFNGEGTRYDNTTCNFTVINILDNNGNATGNDTEDINKSVVSNKINNIENCGTPLIALLIALISLPIIRRK